jgi:hypothetical protein
MSKEDSKGLGRASWEGMSKKEYGEDVNPQTEKFLLKIRDEFYADDQILDFDDVVYKLLDLEEIPEDFLEKLKDSYKSYFGDKKWLLMDEESTRRHLAYDVLKGSTPG